MGHVLWRPALIVAGVLGTAAAVACAEERVEREAPAANAPTSTVVDAAATTTPSSLPVLPTEHGEPPIFWRTTDPLDSLPAGAKVVVRVTNGYEEETLHIAAQPDAGGGEVAFEAARVEAGAGELPGAYYAFNLDLPEPGAWQVTVLAGDDRVTIPIAILPAGG